MTNRCFLTEVSRKCAPLMHRTVLVCNVGAAILLSLLGIGTRADEPRAELPREQGATAATGIARIETARERASSNLFNTDRGPIWAPTLNGERIVSEYSI